jgi:DNA mismatch repair protein MutL
VNRIRLLPEQVANQIAAGEVIERPASVVKELVENALDADARHVTVEIQAGGRSCIRVFDDGVGMGRDDALLCLERHATSKIQTAHDLEAITTMGFRGEAIPSIASVSRFTLTTRPRDDDSPEATQIVIHGGKILDVKSAGHAPGTTVEVRQLFYNLPARRKFLRSEETERTHVLHYVTVAALAHPYVGFTLKQDQRLVWQLPPVPAGQAPLEAVRQRLQMLLGRDLPLIPVDHSESVSSEAAAAEAEIEAATEGATGAEQGRLRVWGFIGAPGVSRGSRQDQHVFVNRRPVENRGINYALFEGYHTSLMKGRYPVCCLFLELDPGQVDVNVHPAKREVKFRNENHVRAIVGQAVRNALLRFHAAHAPAPGGASVTPVSPPSTPPHIESHKPTEDARLPIDFGGGRRGPDVAPARPDLGAMAPAAPLPAAPSAAAGWPRPSVPASGAAAVEAQSPPSVDAGGGRPLLQVPLRLLGVIGRLYAVFESDRGMVLMDQHAAHERVLYEQMLERMERSAAPSQRLLLPETVELGAKDAQFLRENLDQLTRLGVGLSEFGERTFLLDALPPFVKAPNAKRFVLELVDELMRSGRDVNPMRLGEQTIAKTVCRHAVKAHDPLSIPELEKLVSDLRACAMPYTCPHGRPTLLEMNYRDLEKRFGRVT